MVITISFFAIFQLRRSGNIVILFCDLERAMNLPSGFTRAPKFEYRVQVEYLILRSLIFSSDFHFVEPLA